MKAHEKYSKLKTLLNPSHLCILYKKFSHGAYMMPTIAQYVVLSSSSFCRRRNRLGWAVVPSSATKQLIPLNETQAT